MRTVRMRLFLSLLFVASTASASEPTREQLEFFEKKIRPVLVEQCYRCHSKDAKRLKGGLRLDSRQHVLSGGDTGRLFIPGQPRKSLLIQSLRYEDLRMPPNKKLPPKVIANFETWVNMGAPYPPDSNEVTKKTIDFEQARKHWAFRPIHKPDLPQIANEREAETPLDLFILSKLEKHQLALAPLADKRTLIRRLYFDMLGVPPTWKEVTAFESDSSPDAYVKLVDRLLASPKYGERWGRHWLDVARYADTKDLVLLYGKDRIRPFAYTYRDYVIRAFNADLPFDEFVQDQIAADQRDVPQWRLSAMGFLTLGRLFCRNLPDVIDDQIDTVSRGFLGLTVSCARCHDHKYDAIPTADYYSMYGIFASSEVPLELPLLEDPKTIPGAPEVENRLAQKQAEIEKHLEAQYVAITEEARQRVGDYLHRIVAEKKDPLEDVVFFLSLSPGDLKPQLIARWRRFLQRRATAEDPLFGLWHDLSSLQKATFAQKAGPIVERWQKREMHPQLLEALKTTTIKSKADLAKLYGTAFSRTYEAWKKSDQKQRGDPILKILLTQDSPIYFPKRNAWLYMTRVPRGKFNSLILEKDKIAVHAKTFAARARVMVDSSELMDPRIFIRGNPRRPGVRVPRRFLQVLSNKQNAGFTKGSGRLELANAMVARDNPLTARVIANRIWMHHFGEPLVKTPNDFGTRSDPPTHPELLDYLAWYLRENDWSIKKLHRLILLSHAWRQTSRHDSPKAKAVDPENHLLWRAHRRRLDLEAMRDSLLSLSGRLDNQFYGRPVNVAGDPGNRRRTVYGLVDRQDLPPLYRAFDFAGPDQSAARRPETTVPQQALFGLNSPFVLEQVRGVLADAEIQSTADPEKRIRSLYRRILTRDPSPGELDLGLRFVQSDGMSDSQLSTWEQYVQILLLTNELMFVD